jgi:hypothetical protein
MASSSTASVDDHDVAERADAEHPILRKECREREDGQERGQGCMDNCRARRLPRADTFGDRHQDARDRERQEIEPGPRQRRNGFVDVGEAVAGDHEEDAGEEAPPAERGQVRLHGL